MFINQFHYDQKLKLIENQKYIKWWSFDCGNYFCGC